MTSAETVVLSQCRISTASSEYPTSSGTAVRSAVLDAREVVVFDPQYSIVESPLFKAKKEWKI
jgi:hypothetical protein